MSAATLPDDGARLAAGPSVVPRRAMALMRRPNAHPHILAIAAYTLALGGSLDKARTYAEALHRALPRYGAADFLAAFRFDRHGAVLFCKGAKRVGMA